MKKETMKDLVKSTPIVPFKIYEVVEVEILNKTKNAIYADILGLTEGVIPIKEWGEEGEKIKPGERTLAYVLLLEDEGGKALLSLKRADSQRLHSTLIQKHRNKETISVRCIEANKGGVMCEIGPVKGFLPVSQLSSSHYPRVFGDKEKILAKLKELIGQDLRVKIIGFDKKTNHPIFSEKATQPELTSKIIRGEILEGEITGITDFGIFVNLGDFDGLVHISEVSWAHVEDLSKLFKVGEKVRVKVLNVEDGRVFLSLKRLTPDPFLASIKKYKEADIVKGEVTRVVPFGAFVKLDDIEGLVNLVELSEKRITDPKEVVKVGERYKFKIIKIEKEARRINLSLKQATAKTQKRVAKTQKRAKKKRK